MTKLFELVVGDRFVSNEETGGFVYQKTGKVDQFGSILCEPVNTAPYPFNVFDTPHWHRKYESVMKVEGGHKSA